MPREWGYAVRVSRHEGGDPSVHRFCDILFLEVIRPAPCPKQTLGIAVPRVIKGDFPFPGNTSAVRNSRVGHSSMPVRHERLTLILEALLGPFICSV